MLARIKKALRIVTNAFDDELTGIIASCIQDLNLAGIVGETVVPTSTDELVIQAVIAYAKWRFGEPDNPDKARELYEIQKAQLAVATGYTDWLVNSNG